MRKLRVPSERVDENLVFYHRICPICKSLLGFELNEEGEVEFKRETPFIRACKRMYQLTGIRTRAIELAPDSWHELLLYSMVRTYKFHTPCMIGPLVGFWPGPIPPNLSEEEYLLVLLGEKKPPRVT